MANLVLVDSSYYIRMASQRRDPFLELAVFADDYDFATCGIVWIEVVRGRTPPTLRDRFDAAFRHMVFLDAPPAGWQRTARLTWELDRRGCVLPATDLAIASCALAHQATVLTFAQHFSNVPGLTVVDALT